MANRGRNIDEYNKSISPEKRAENARNAGKAPKKKCILNRIAKHLNDMPAPTAANKLFEEFGITGEDTTNGALVVLAVLKAAAEGDPRAVDKWEKWIGQSDITKRENLENELLKEKIKSVKENGCATDPVQIVVQPRKNKDDEPT